MKIPRTNGKSLKVRFQFSCLMDGEGRIDLASCMLERRGLGNRERRQGPRIASTSVQELRRFSLQPGEIRMAGHEKDVPHESSPLHVLRKGSRLSLRYFHPSPNSRSRQADVFSRDSVNGQMMLDHSIIRELFISPLDAGQINGGEMVKGDEIKRQRMAILEKNPNFIAMADARGRLVYLNPAGRALLKMAEDQDPSCLSLFDCYTAESRENLLINAMSYAEQYGVWSGDAVLLTGQGQEIPTTQVMIAHYGEEGCLNGFSVVEQDMSVWLRSENALRLSQEELQRLSDQLITIQETERQRIAADLHDCLGQYLSLIKLSLENAIHQVNDGATEEAAESLKRLIPKVKDTLTEVRRLAMDLRPSTLDDLGILATLSWFFREFEEHCHTIKVEKDFAVQESDIPLPVKISIFRILQEAVNNIVKHAKASLIRISLKKENDSLLMSIEDNGKGFDTAVQRLSPPTPEDGGLGLLGMKERAHVSGGTLNIESSPGHGARINAWWPLGGM